MKTLTGNMIPNPAFPAISPASKTPNQNGATLNSLIFRLYRRANSAISAKMARTGGKNSHRVARSSSHTPPTQN